MPTTALWPSQQSFFFFFFSRTQPIHNICLYAKILLCRVHNSLKDQSFQAIHFQGKCLDDKMLLYADHRILALSMVSVSGTQPMQTCISVRKKTKQAIGFDAKHFCILAFLMFSISGLYFLRTINICLLFSVCCL